MEILSKQFLRQVNTISKLFQPLNIRPKDALLKSQKDNRSKSQKLMLDLGIIRHSDTGIYHFLPLGLRALNKLKAIIRSEMNKIGGQEIEMSAIINASLWEKSGRWETSKDELFRFTDRHGLQYALAPTNEESAARLFSNSLNLSYNSFPLLLYQINSKFRDEIKPRCGLIRGREFVMKDLYSFDISVKEAKATYEIVAESYKKIFSILGLSTFKTSADPGEIGGFFSHEYHLPCDIGEDVVNICKNCGTPCFLNTPEDVCPSCKSCSFDKRSTLEIAHTFLLGSKYSEPLNATFMSFKGTPEPLVMGSYGIGVSRILSGSVEQLSNNEEIRWPRPITPYQIVIIPPKDGSKELPAVGNAHYKVYHHLNSITHLTDDLLLDDRGKMTIGKRILDAKKVGYPFIIVVGPKATQNPAIYELIDVYFNKVSYVSFDELVSFFTGQKMPYCINNVQF